jgi:hypothetical protein
MCGGVGRHGDFEHSRDVHDIDIESGSGVHLHKLEYPEKIFSIFACTLQQRNCSQSSRADFTNVIKLPEATLKPCFVIESVTGHKIRNIESRR